MLTRPAWARVRCSAGSGTNTARTACCPESSENSPIASAATHRPARDAQRARAVVLAAEQRGGRDVRRQLDAQQQGLAVRGQRARRRAPARARPGGPRAPARRRRGTSRSARPRRRSGRARRGVRWPRARPRPPVATSGAVGASRRAASDLRERPRRRSASPTSACSVRPSRARASVAQGRPQRVAHDQRADQDRRGDRHARDHRRVRARVVPQAAPDETARACRSGGATRRPARSRRRSAKRDGEVGAVGHEDQDRPQAAVQVEQQRSDRRRRRARRGCRSARRTAGAPAASRARGRWRRAASRRPRAAAGRWSSRAPRPTASSSSCARGVRERVRAARRASAPARSRAPVSCGSRQWSWNTKPTRRLRNAASSRSRTAARDPRPRA